MKKNILKNFKYGYHLISFVVTDNITEWYILPADYWIMKSWSQYDIPWQLSIEEQCELFLEVIQEFKVCEEDLKNAYWQVKEEQLFDEILIKPFVYADFTNKVFSTFFGEWDLELSLHSTWKTRKFELTKLIPEENRYWKESEESN